MKAIIYGLISAAIIGLGLGLTKQQHQDANIQSTPSAWLNGDGQGALRSQKRFGEGKLCSRQSTGSAIMNCIVFSFDSHVHRSRLPRAERSSAK